MASGHSGGLPGIEALSSEQASVVTTWGKGQAVLAGAGSGKTTTLVIKCRELIRRNPKAQIAAVSFTEKSASDLKEKLSRVFFEEGLTDSRDRSSHWVTTIHGLCSNVVRAHSRLVGLDGEEEVLNETEAQTLWNRAVDRVWFGELPDLVAEAFEVLSARETRPSLLSLLDRVRRLHSFGLFELKKTQAEDPEFAALQTLSEYVLKWYGNFKQRRGALDFEDLEVYARRVLQHPEVREVYRERFDLVLVDEFQDTNPIQAEVIWNFSREDHSNLCVVGDPKQSIYRFRDADVSLFEERCSQLPVRHQLTWNFRSRPQIIEKVNEICTEAFPYSRLTYDSLVPKRENKEKEESVFRLDVSNPEDLGRWILGEVKKEPPWGTLPCSFERSEAMKSGSTLSQKWGFRLQLEVEACSGRTPGFESWSLF